MSVEIAMQWNRGYSESVYTFANTINTHEGGTHEEGFRAALTSLVNRYARDKKLLKEKDDDLTGEDIREGLAAIISVKLGEPAVRGPDQDQAGQHRGEDLRAEGLQRAARPTGSTATRPRPRTSSRKAIQAARARRRGPQGPRPDPPQGAAGVGGLPGKLADCQSNDPTRVRDLHRRG